MMKRSSEARSWPQRQRDVEAGAGVRTASGKGEKMRLGLDKDDELELLRWVQQSSLERVARIVAFLADARGEHGQPEKPDTLLLLKIAHLKREQPHRTLHSIAVEVARDADQLRRPRISRESLVTKLERDYKRRRHTGHFSRAAHHRQIRRKFLEA